MATAELEAAAAAWAEALGCELRLLGEPGGHPLAAHEHPGPASTARLRSVRSRPQLLTIPAERPLGTAWGQHGP
jgi:hypothetical protein